MNPYKICFVSSEVVPFAKTGGLADVAGSLPIALKELEQDIRVMMTKYKSINERKFVLREVIRLKEVNLELDNISGILCSVFCPISYQFIELPVC